MRRLEIFWKFMGLMKKDVLLSSSAANCSWQVSSLSETKAHQVMQQKATSFIHFNQRQLSRIYPSSYRVDSSNFNPQPFWSAGCQLGMSLIQVTVCSMITVQSGQTFSASTDPHCCRFSC